MTTIQIDPDEDNFSAYINERDRARDIAVQLEGELHLATQVIDAARALISEVTMTPVNVNRLCESLALYDLISAEAIA